MEFNKSKITSAAERVIGSVIDCIVNRGPLAAINYTTRLKNPPVILLEPELIVPTQPRPSDIWYARGFAALFVSVPPTLLVVGIAQNRPDWIAMSGMTGTTILHGVVQFVRSSREV